MPKRYRSYAHFAADASGIFVCREQYVCPNGFPSTKAGALDHLLESCMSKTLAFSLVGALLGLPLVGQAQTATVNGVTFPVGIVAGGNQLQAGIVNESLITSAGQTLQGVGFVAAITNAASTVVWQDGMNGVRLGFTFDNYVARSVLAPTNATPGQVSFIGGTVDFYTLAAGTSISGSGVSGDIARIRSGNLFLSLTAPSSDAAGDTLLATLPQGSSLTSFSAGSGFGFLDVVGGAVRNLFDTNTFGNAFDTAGGGFSDLIFTSSFRTGTGGDFPIGGTANLNANAVSPVPEAETYTLLMAGLGALGFVARRRRRA
jgi:hypothetical protein